MFENPRRGRQARKFTKNVPKILDLKSSSEQIFSENWRKVPLVIRWWRVDLLMAVSQDVSHMNREFSVAQWQSILSSHQNAEGHTFDSCVRSTRIFSSEPPVSLT